jgi:putative selenium metabolism protein SsnA
VLIVNGTLVTFGSDHRVIPYGGLRIEDGLIAEVSTSHHLLSAYPSEAVLDAQGGLVMPGLICAHTHFYGLFARGMAMSGEAPASFPDILRHLWWRLDKLLTLEDIRYSALVCLADAIRSGTTTLFDHHASPLAVAGSLDTIAAGVEQAGVRACLCYEVSDRDGPEIADAGLRENAGFIAGVRKRPGLLSSSFGLHASLTLSDQTMENAKVLADSLDSGFHIHVAEDVADVRDALEREGVRVVPRLARHGILGPKTIAAHCVHINAEEREILRETGTHVVHNPRSNMNNAVGVADVPAMLAAGIAVGLGNDGFSNNMFSEIKTAYLMHKLAARDPRVFAADQALQVAVGNNAAIAEGYFPRPLGRLAPGACADVIILDYDPPTPLTESNLPWHVVFGMDAGHVNTTVVDGKVLMHDRKLTTLDEQEISARSRELAEKLWARA